MARFVLLPTQSSSEALSQQPASRTIITPLVVDTVDGFPTRSQKLSSHIGDAPLESGASITDHSVLQPEEIDIEGFVSDLSQTAGVYSGARAQFAWRSFRKLMQEATPLRVVTPWGVIDEMLIAEVTGREAGLGMKFSMKLRELIRVGATAVATTPAAGSPADGRLGETNRGRIQTEQLTELTLAQARALGLDAADLAPQPDLSGVTITGSDIDPQFGVGITDGADDQ